MGTVWSFQGAGYLLGSFMSNNPTWLYIGSVTAVVGVVLAILGFRANPAKKPGL